VLAIIFLKMEKDRKSNLLNQLKDNLGENHQYEWCFVNVPSTKPTIFNCKDEKKLSFHRSSGNPIF